MHDIGFFGRGFFMLQYTFSTVNLFCLLEVAVFHNDQSSAWSKSFRTLYERRVLHGCITKDKTFFSLHLFGRSDDIDALSESLKKN